MGYRRLEIVIQSALGLKCVNPDKEVKPYAVVFICNNNNNRISAEHKTGNIASPSQNLYWTVDNIVSAMVVSAV
uniref:Uncharacterized protein n=1 Tax=Fagus sylvatica TaxID=28930 RepID=A0A2N9J998_FAGSY